MRLGIWTRGEYGGNNQIGWGRLKNLGFLDLEKELFLSQSEVERVEGWYMDWDQAASPPPSAMVFIGGKSGTLY